MGTELRDFAKCLSHSAPCAIQLSPHAVWSALLVGECKFYRNAMPKNTKAMFEKMFVVTPGCWLWIGRLHLRGYGRFRSPAGDMAHRSSYYFYKGDVPENMQVCHRCDNPRCVNPDHLFLGTNQDNVDDKVSKGRHPVCDGSTSSKLTMDKVIEARSLYKPRSKEFSTRKLAEKFGITHGQMWRIVANKAWPNKK